MSRWAEMHPSLIWPGGVCLVPRRIFPCVCVVRLALGVFSFPFRVVGPAVVEYPVLLGHLLGGQPVAPGLIVERESTGLVDEAPVVCPSPVFDRLVWLVGVSHFGW